MARPLVLFAGATLCGTSAVAQTPQTPSQPAGRLILSVGTDALAREFGDATPGIAAHGGYERRVGRSGSSFAVRIAGDYWRAGRMFTGT